MKGPTTIKNRKLLWAVDAFEAPFQVQRRAAHALRLLVTREPEMVIEPVYVLSPAQLNLSVEFSAPWVAQYQPAAERALVSLCESLEIPQVVQPTVIVQNFASTSHAVAALTEHALESGAEGILVGSHGRSGMRRLLLGSFAESLLLSSPVPVMVIGPHIRKAYDLDHVLFPTDFAEHSEEVFRRVVGLCKDLGAKLTIFHAIPSPIEPVLQSGVYLLGGAWMPVHSYFSRETERHQKHANAWARWARKQGVQTETVVDARVGSIVDSILELAAKGQVGLIAMEAQSGPMVSALIGSITRQVLRRAECPTWIFRSGPLAREAALPSKKPLPRAA